MFANRRFHKRYGVKAAAKILYASHVLDLPIRDISLAGIGLETPGPTVLSGGNLCLVELPDHGKLDAMVVGVNARSCHLQFMLPDAEEVRAFIAAHAGKG